MKEWTDEKLVSIFRETADQACFGELVERYTGNVRAAVLGMVQSDADADDITQEIFIRVARGLARFRARSTFKTWLYRITMNTTRSFLRSKIRRNELIAARTDGVPDVPGRHTDRPDRRAVARELGGQLESALAALPEHFRAALVLTILEGHDVADVARIEGCTRATIYWRIHQARRLLREAMGERIKS